MGSAGVIRSLPEPGTSTWRREGVGLRPEVETGSGGAGGVGHKVEGVLGAAESSLVGFQKLAPAVLGTLDFKGEQARI